jgi:hypothetical protein
MNPAPTISPGRRKYLRTLNIEENDSVSTVKLRRALHRAYELRTFEIEHYWKRATYFWGFQIAIFAAFGLLWRELAGSGSASASAWNPVAVLLCGLGVITAVANLLSAWGSRFWQKNWEKHIDALEKEVEGNLHKTIWLREGKVSFSVSRLNEALAWSLILFWGLLFIYLGLKSTASSMPAWLEADRSLLWFSLITLLVAAGIVFLLSKRTDLLGTFPNAQGGPGSPIVVSRWTGKVSERDGPSYVLRNAPDEEDAAARDATEAEE